MKVENMITDIKFIDVNGFVTIRKFEGLSNTAASLLIPSDNYIRLDKDWKVAQIIKEVVPNPEINEVRLVVYVYLCQIHSYDEWLL